MGTCRLKQKRVIHEVTRRTTKGRQGAEVIRDGIARSRRHGPLICLKQQSLFSKFGRVRELLPGRVVPPGSAGVPPACSSFRCFRRRLRACTRGQVLSLPTRLDSWANPVHGFTPTANCCRGSAARFESRLHGWMHRFFSGKVRLAIPGTGKAAPDHRPSRLPVQ